MSIITNEEREYLLNSMKSLLEEYDYTYTDEALDTIITEWADNKESLIEAFKRHPNYLDGKFMITFTKGFERVQNSAIICDFISYVLECVRVCCDKIPQEIKDRKGGCTWLPDTLWNLISIDLRNYKSTTIDDDLAATFETAIPELRVRAGQKTSRVVNKLCTYLGIATDSAYNRRFAQYADAINPIIITYKIVLSINPLDYLTMSFGNSWASCHTIDKSNKRGMPNSYSGMYSSGTISYMLDKTSMVLYTVDTKYTGDEYWNQPKINRQMYHYSNNKLIQARLYPQSNDGDGSVYTPYRNVVQEIMATIFDFPNLWTCKKGTSEIYNVVSSVGTHYRDYINFNSCNISFAKDQNVDGVIHIGHRPICIECGCLHDRERNINCCSGATHTCASCGYDLDEDDDDIVYIHGEAYCRECVTYCEDCDDYYRNEDVYYIESVDRYVCGHCRDNYYEWCPHCEEYHNRDDMYYIEDTNEYVCAECFHARYFECEECGKYLPKKQRHVYNHGYLCEDCYNKAKEEETEE